ncbi:unnamed protein product [Lactuca virosa]|uniref:Uncharacterized protein n=1 Tax=Lactuca virosa TaxID=75947 RepID=A0AAU9MUY8_9ASTR|nr:unnamed protein product [Lactuca virosa]
MFSSITYMKAYKFRLTPMNGSNLWPTTDYTPPLPPVRRTMRGRPATKRKRDATENQTRHNKRACTLTRPPKIKARRKTKHGGAQAVNEVDEVNEGDEGNEMNEGNQGNAMNEGNQGNAMNEGDKVNEGDQAVNDDGGAVNDGGEAVNEVNVQQQEARETPITARLKKIRKKKSERIVKLKLGKIVGDADAPGNSEAKPLTLE